MRNILQPGDGLTNAKDRDGCRPVIERGSIVVRDGRIVSVAAGAATGQGQTIDARGMTALPGFIDAHRHIMSGNDDRWFKEQSTDRMREFLEAGYTTLMSGGGPFPGIIELKRRVESGALNGPRIITSGRVDPDNFKTEDLARAQVRKYAQAGIEIIKARIDPEPTADQKAILAVVVDEGRKNKLDVMVHAVSVPAMLAALDAGATKLVHTPHGGWLSIEDARKVAAAGVETLSTIGFGVPCLVSSTRTTCPRSATAAPGRTAFSMARVEGVRPGKKR